MGRRSELDLFPDLWLEFCKWGTEGGLIDALYFAIITETREDGKRRYATAYGVAGVATRCNPWSRNQPRLIPWPWAKLRDHLRGRDVNCSKQLSFVYAFVKSMAWKSLDCINFLLNATYYSNSTVVSNFLTTISGIQTFKMPAPNKKMKNVSIYNVLSCFWGIIARISPLFSNFAIIKFFRIWRSQHYFSSC